MSANCLYQSEYLKNADYSSSCRSCEVSDHVTSLTVQVTSAITHKRRRRDYRVHRRLSPLWRARRITTNPTRRIIHKRPNPVSPTSRAELALRPRPLCRRDATRSIIWPVHSQTLYTRIALRYVATAVTALWKHGDCQARCFRFLLILVLSASEL